MDKNKKIIILIVLCVVVVLGIIIYFVATREKSPTPDQDATPIKKVVIDKESAAKVVLPPPTDSEKQAASVKNIALSFAERFGTFTNQSNYQSFNDLKPVLTAATQVWLQNSYLPMLMKEHDPRGFFYRIVTDARTAEILEQTATSVKVKIAAQREETKGDAAPQSFIQNLVIDLVLENNNWLINGVYWEKK